VTSARNWLRSRLGDAPPELLRAMLAALPAEDGPVPDALAAAALGLYTRVLESSGGRNDALPLLAADALLTHAVEAQAEEDPEGLSAFVDRWGAAGRLGELVDRVEPK
jgi:hypothetical protein